MSGVPTVVTTVDWPEDSQKFDIYTNEEGMYELLFSSQQPKAKEFRKHCCNLMFPHVHQQLTNKMEDDHQQAIKEKDVALAQCDNQIRAIQHENVALQAQRDVCISGQATKMSRPNPRPCYQSSCSSWK